LVIHSEDIYRPLGVGDVLEPESLNITLAQLTSPRARGALAPGLLDGLALRTTDTGWAFGTGPEAAGPAASLLLAIFGRSVGLADLTGEGAALLGDRLRSHNSR
ncbi:MAG TPA: DinB family protein, partial [Propionibacteriaceae bacterium]